MQRASFRHIKGVSYDLKIGLIDVDSHNFPNLCLMKLSAYHKAKGHTVEWWNAKGRYDLVYKSRVFTDTYSKDTITVTNAEQVIFGGTGYDTKNRLPPEVEHSYPDYSIYPQFFGIAYGFLSRGCPRNCGFCIVSSKEGRKSVKVADLSEFWKWQPEIKIMDANLLACPDHENLIEQLIRSRASSEYSLHISYCTPLHSCCRNAVAIFQHIADFLIEAILDVNVLFIIDCNAFHQFYQNTAIQTR